MKFLTKSLLSAGAAAAALVSVSAPAQAQRYDRYDRYDRHRDGISAGEVIAGAVVLGGLAAVIASADNDRNYDGYNGRYDNGYNSYNRNGGSRAAISQCVNAVERRAGAYSRSDVTQIRDIDRTRYGYRVSGNIAVQDGWRDRDQDRYERYDNRYGDGRYGDNRYGDRRYDGGQYGYDSGYDRGRFTCYVERGRVVDIDYNGLKQWR